MHEKRRERGRTYRVGLILGFCLLIAVNGLFPVSCVYAEEEQTKIAYGENTPGQLYARSAVLMDADSGRILFAKNAETERPMASTTKIMTCILALERADPDESVSVSANAAAQPRVRLGTVEGQKFKLKDLLYSLMLESHNDTAVMLAEHLAGSVEQFADEMNQKARELGLSHTHFVTPNGLDGADDGGSHRTTAKELARIMRYCVMESSKRKEFLEITGASSYQFSDLEQTQTYSCINHNAFLTMMEGAISGKTGFTGEAGYCYVGALKREKRTFIVALLACGWPNNRSYKWEDTKKLMEYGLEHFEYQSSKRRRDKNLNPGDGWDSGFQSESGVYICRSTVRAVKSFVSAGRLGICSGKKEHSGSITGSLSGKGTEVGTIEYRVNGETLARLPVVIQRSVGKIDFFMVLEENSSKIFLKRENILK